MMRAPAAIALAIATHIACVDFAGAEALLRVEGNALKWAPAPSDTRTVVTYATLTAPYFVPADRPTLSPENCGAMHAFADIVAKSPGVSTESAKRELQSALAAWTAVADIRFVEVDDARVANIIIGAADAPGGKAFPGGRAFANLVYRSGQESRPVAKALGKAGPNLSLPVREGVVTAIEQAYVCLNPRSQWKVGFDGNLDVYDLRHTFTHEIGHAIGLDHPESSGSLMAYRYDERLNQLQPSDIADVQRLYGPPVPGK